MRIPSTQALRALDSFARHGSVWRAADELHLTRSAVSHQLRLLERELGFELFQRVGKGMALTVRGRRYAGDVRKALTVLGDAGVQGDNNGIGGPFGVSCTPGFASLWLCAHIGEFQSLYPDIALSITTPRRLDDVAAQGPDIFIAFGDGNWPDRAVELLCEIEFTPLCSPVLLNKVGGLVEPADVLKAPLLHLGDFEDWTRSWSTPKRPIPPSRPLRAGSDRGSRKRKLLPATPTADGVAFRTTPASRAAQGKGEEDLSMAAKQFGCRFFRR